MTHQIEVDEAPDGAQTKDDKGRLWVWCDCTYGDKCPNNKSADQKGLKCLVLMDTRRLKKKEVKRILADRR